MFSKDILKQDLEALDSLQAQRNSCARLIRDSIRELLESNNSSKIYIADEKSAIQALNDKLLELDKEILLLEEQMFLNYTNEFSINNKPSNHKPFPHINTLK